MHFANIWLEPKQVTGLGPSEEWSLTWDVDALLNGISGEALHITVSGLVVDLLAHDGDDVGVIPFDVILSRSQFTPGSTSQEYVAIGDLSTPLTTIDCTGRMTISGVSGAEVSDLTVSVCPYIIGSYTEPDVP